MCSTGVYSTCVSHVYYTCICHTCPTCTSTHVIHLKHHYRCSTTGNVCIAVSATKYTKQATISFLWGGQNITSEGNLFDAIYIYICFGVAETLYKSMKKHNTSEANIFLKSLLLPPPPSNQMVAP